MAMNIYKTIRGQGGHQQQLGEQLMGMVRLQEIGKVRHPTQYQTINIIADHFKVKVMLEVFFYQNDFCALWVHSGRVTVHKEVYTHILAYFYVRYNGDIPTMFQYPILTFPEFCESLDWVL